MLTAVGGFVDMGGIVTASQAGARYRFALLWTLIPGLIGLIVYAEMVGRVTINSSRTLFDVIRDRLGSRLALIPLISTAIVNSLTLVVEQAGMTLALQVATHISYLLWFPLATLFLAVILWRLDFDVLDNGAAIMGLTMLVTVVAMVRLAPPWHELGVNLVHPSLGDVKSLPAYLFFVISLLGSYMTPYQFSFYSSGAIEEEWSGRELLTNRVTAVVGSLFGAGIDFALIVIAALVLFPKHLPVNTLADAAAPTKSVFGVVGLAIFLVGAFAVSMGAGLATALRGAYSVSQYVGCDWARRGSRRRRRSSRSPIWSCC